MTIGLNTKVVIKTREVEPKDIREGTLLMSYTEWDNVGMTDDGVITTNIKNLFDMHMFDIHRIKCIDVDDLTTGWTAEDIVHLERNEFKTTNGTVSNEDTSLEVSATILLEPDRYLEDQGYEHTSLYRVIESVKIQEYASIIHDITDDLVKDKIEVRIMNSITHPQIGISPYTWVWCMPKDYVEDLPTTINGDELVFDNTEEIVKKFLEENNLSLVHTSVLETMMNNHQQHMERCFRLDSINKTLGNQKNDLIRKVSDLKDEVSVLRDQLDAITEDALNDGHKQMCDKLHYKWEE